MKLCYQTVTPDAAIADSVTTYQEPLARTFGDLGALGYDGVELMTLNPGKLDQREMKKTAKKNNLPVALVCTSEILGQLGLSYTHPHRSLRRRAAERTKEIVNFADYPGANVNMGRIRGQYCRKLNREETIELVRNASTELADYTAPKNADIVLETVTVIQTNFINTLTEGATMADRVGRPNFRLVMNIFHLNLEEKDLYEATRTYSGHNIHVHPVDNNRRYSGQCGPDFERILTVFWECGYDGNYCTEVFQFPSVEEAARGSIQCLRPIADRAYGGNTHYSEVG